LIQFWKEIAVEKLRTAMPATLAWGKHMRNGLEISYGTLKPIQDGDSLQVELLTALASQKGKQKSGKIPVEYTLGEAPRVYSMSVKSTFTVETLRGGNGANPVGRNESGRRGFGRRLDLKAQESSI
jgi:hypothetical protein